ncbi:hypothetical protein HN958_03935 [Candidatus Falkowbacteria bacterium]|nr:hypothetical protein [Candidatus Falkowbacteria bacterium]MBT7007628.1 hypothetical protein [Candidatus Falkowbacteria bacterium]
MTDFGKCDILKNQYSLTIYLNLYILVVFVFLVFLAREVCMCGNEQYFAAQSLCGVIFSTNAAAVAVEVEIGESRLHSDLHPKFTIIVYEEGQEETVPEGDLVFWRRSTPSLKI